MPVKARRAPARLESAAAGGETGSSAPSPGTAAGALEPQVVQVVLPDGDAEVRLACLDVASGKLDLHQVDTDDHGGVSIGNSATLKLSNIGHASVEGQALCLRAGGETGRLLLQIQFEGAGLAQAWAECVRSATGQRQRSPKQGSAPAAISPAASSPTAAGASAASPEANSTLRELIKQQQEQVRLLEEIIARKGDQLLKMQERLEDALSMLQVGQQTYGQQQGLLDEQKKQIEQMQNLLQASDAAEKACYANAASAAAGAATAARAGARGPVARTATASGGSSPSMTKRAGQPPSSVSPEQASSFPAGNELERIQELFRLLGTVQDIGGQVSQAAGNAGTCASDPVEESQLQLSSADVGAANSEEDVTALMEKLQSLEAEKRHFEAMLHSEQSQIVEQLQDLQGMMAALGLESTTSAAD